ncbi:MULTISPECIES: M13 family metallopeptidase [Acinetobacter]|uniref:M13 family metallopeptidase n=1 Tax=Acinetobacter TaxID=469 RepID=UPI0004D74557|nr:MULTISPECIES: M13 family metallopeptidase [Acinetobacter]KEC85982.1 peptidase M13 [Acinetobacter sp. ETR1]MDO6642872.1 M13 family metallopeptidase [Acinetobacter guillouiae]UOH17608.1 M13 family metallopeptidase [Acinetobacter sp. NyZ410]WEE40529.1 M13 family metallopeptidase [Acinetobacter sp. TAC-1]
MKLGFVKSVLASAIMLSSAPVWAETTGQITQTTSAIVKDQKKSGIDHQYFDQNVKGNDDFYQHVNGGWLKNTEIPADKSRWGTFDILHEESLKQLHDIVDELSKQQLVEGSSEQKVASLYANFMDEKSIEALGIQPIQAEITNVDALKSKKDIAQLAAHFSRIGVTSPFDVGIDQDMKNSTEMVAMLGQSGLGLPDRDYYLKNDAKFKKIRSQYLKYIEKTLSLAGDKQAAQHAQGILKLETQIAKIQWSNVQNRDVTKLYNIYKTQDLAKLSPKIDWQTYLEKQELSDKIKTIQVIQPSYFKGLSPIVDNTSLEVWKAYFKFHLVSDFSSLLSQAFVDNSFDFYSKQLREIKEQKPRWKRGVQLVEGTLGESLGQIYVKKYFSAEKKQRMEVLVQNLMKAYSQSIDKLDWMSPTTKVQAQKKLASFAVKIGYPNKWRDYSALEIKNNDLIGNVIRSREFEHQYALNKLGKPVDRDEWGMTPQTINAYYNASLNEIVFPAAILQPPFFDMDADDAVNYGAIGAIIGHEISHGFDDQGSQFDELGNMKNWWTAEDHRKFKEKTNTLVAQYNAYEPIKGYHVNGELTLGENIADNSGLAIAYKAYQLSLNGKAAPVLDNLTGEQRFYIGWAQAWRSKITDAMQVEFLKRDPHSPDKVRGNATLLNQAPFYDAFHIQQGDKMYLPANKRVTIW